MCDSSAEMAVRRHEEARQAGGQGSQHRPAEEDLDKGRRAPSGGQSAPGGQDSEGTKENEETLQRQYELGKRREPKVSRGE